MSEKKLFGRYKTCVIAETKAEALKIFLEKQTEDYLSAFKHRAVNYNRYRRSFIEYDFFKEEFSDVFAAYDRGHLWICM